MDNLWIWLVVSISLKKMRVRQLGWWFPIYIYIYIYIDILGVHHAPNKENRIGCSILFFLLVPWERLPPWIHLVLINLRPERRVWLKHPKDLTILRKGSPLFPSWVGGREKKDVEPEYSGRLARDFKLVAKMAPHEFPPWTSSYYFAKLRTNWRYSWGTPCSKQGKPDWL